jgi:hypothetical protein
MSPNVRRTYSAQGEAGEAAGAPLVTRPTVVCITPVRNEAWTMERFLRCAEIWADHIVIADQDSSDATRSMADSSTKTVVVPNPTVGYDEGEYHRVLLSAARAVPGPRVIIAVDADEALSANVQGSAAWEKAIRSPPGTVLTAEWVNYLPGTENVWVPKSGVPIGLVDDGRQHNPGSFHVDRIAVNSSDRQVTIDPVKLLHFQYLDWRRMKSKQRRYQCAEAIANPTKRPIQFYRQYHRMDSVPKAEVRPAHPGWLSGFKELGIDVTAVESERVFASDREVLAMLREYGMERFGRLDIWDGDWLNHVQAETSLHLADPRTSIDRLIHRWLAYTQRRDPDRWTTRLFQRALIPFGW